MRFLLTKELGRLAKWLRILGFDSEYFRQENISSLIIQALREDRIILTKNHRLPEIKGTKVLLLETDLIKQQLAEVLAAFKISPEKQALFSRCIICNALLVKIEKGKIKDKVPEYVFKTQQDFVSCPNCSRVYWQGTHWGNVAQTLTEIKS